MKYIHIQYNAIRCIFCPCGANSGTYDVEVDLGPRAHTHQMHIHTTHTHKHTDSFTNTYITVSSTSMINLIFHKRYKFWQKTLPKLTRALTWNSFALYVASLSVACEHVMIDDASQSYGALIDLVFLHVVESMFGRKHALSMTRLWTRVLQERPMWPKFKIKATENVGLK